MIIYHKTKYKISTLVGLVVLVGLLSAIGYLSLSRPEVEPEAKHPQISRGTPIDQRESGAVVNGDILSSPGTSQRAHLFVPGEQACDKHRADPTIQASETGLNLALKNERRRLAATLDAESDPIARAAGKYFAIKSRSYVDYKDCKDSFCDPGAEDRFLSETRDMVGSLVALASMSESSDAYAWAVNACGAEDVRSKSEHPCATLSRRKLIDLDRSNGWNWLALAAEANGKGDSLEVSDALFHAANSQNWEESGTRFNRILAEHIDSNVDPLVLLNILNNVKSISNEMSLSGVNAMALLCPANADVNRLQICQALASSVLKYSNNIVELSVSLKVGERVGLSEEQLRKSRVQFDKVHDLQPAAGLLNSTDAFASCRRALPIIGFLEQSLREGELKALQTSTGVR